MGTVLDFFERWRGFDDGDSFDRGFLESGFLS
jgi:hypothetical protein